jgi:hypothetical protein
MFDGVQKGPEWLDQNDKNHRGSCRTSAVAMSQKTRYRTHVRNLGSACLCESRSVNSHLSNLITICRSGSFPRRIKQLRSSARANFSSVFTFCLRFFNVFPRLP